MKLTKHAQKRWQQRFPDLNIEEQFLAAKVGLGKKMRKKVKATCPSHVKYCDKAYMGRYMKQTPQGIIFVVAPPETVITVLDFRKQ